MHCSKIRLLEKLQTRNAEKAVVRRSLFIDSNFATYDWIGLLHFEPFFHRSSTRVIHRSTKMAAQWTIAPPVLGFNMNDLNAVQVTVSPDQIDHLLSF